MEEEGGVTLGAKKKAESDLKRNVTIRFTADEVEWLEETAKKQFRPVAGIVRYIIAQYRRELEAKTAASRNS